MNIVNVYTNNNEIVDSGIFYKIGKTKYMRQLVDGKLYMKNLKYYQGVENSVIGDKCEGLFFHGTEGKILLGETEIARVRDINVYSKVKFPIYCVSKPCFINMNNGSYEFVLAKDIVERMCIENGESYSIVIIQKEKFIERIETAINKLGISCKCGDVIYNETGRPIVNTKAEMEDKVGFVKKDTYDYQKEYRFMFNTEVEDYFEIDIGNMNKYMYLFEIDKPGDMKFEYRFK